MYIDLVVFYDAVLLAIASGAGGKGFTSSRLRFSIATGGIVIAAQVVVEMTEGRNVANRRDKMLIMASA